MIMAKYYIVPIITSYYEYMRINAESPEDAVQKVKDGDGAFVETWTEFREVLDIREDSVEEDSDQTPHADE